MDGAMTAIKFIKQAGFQGIGEYHTATGYNPSQILHFLRSTKDDGFFKQANEGNESGFEQAFSSLAYAYMKDKAPRLLDFLVGFQLVDRNDDNTKAMGLFGFQVGGQWLYAPVFFLNGDLKGHELLYIKKKDAFVPMKENWVNYIMARKPHVLGEGSQQDTYQLGGREPDIYNLSVSPSVGIGKRGMDDWAKPALPVVAALMTKQAKTLYSTAKPGTKLAFDQVTQQPAAAALAEIAGKFDLGQILPHNMGLLKSAFELSRAYPAVKKGFDQFYGTDCFSRWGLLHKRELLRKEAQLIPTQTKRASDQGSSVYFGPSALIPEANKPNHPIKSGALSIYVYETVSVTRNGEELDETGEDQLTQDDRSDLQSHGYLVKDERKGEEISKAYNTQVEQKLCNPHETGLWEVLEKPGTFDRMLVISNPHTNAGRKNFCTVIRIGDSGKKAWLNSHRTNLWANKVESREEYEKWFDGLGGRDSLKKNGIYVAIDEKGSGTTPFEVRESYGDGSYKVNFKDYCDWSHRRVPSLPHVASENDIDGEHVSSYGAKLFVDAEGKKGTKLRAIQGDLRVPGTFKFLEIKAPPKPQKPEGGCLMPCDYEPDSGSEDRAINPGKIEDLQMLFHEKTARLKIYDDHNEVSITSPLGTQRMQKRAAFFSLIRDHGFTEHVANCMLKQAEAKTQRTFRVKYAPGFGSLRHMTKEAMPNMSMLAGGPGAPAMPPPEMGFEMFGNRNGAQAQYPDEQHMLVPELDSSMGDSSVHDIWQNYTAEDFQKTMGTAQQAAQEGQKEVFDTAMIGSMLKAVRQDSLVDRYLGDLMKALDKLGRILFMFYWHQEEFEDRYGKQDLPELEDSLRNSFEVLGDVVLFLKEKTVETDFDDLGEVDIEEAARN
jgi:hypothetical protein